MKYPTNYQESVMDVIWDFLIELLDWIGIIGFFFIVIVLHVMVRKLEHERTLQLRYEDELMQRAKIMTWKLWRLGALIMFFVFLL